jgi:hypothetical protein
MELLTTLLDSMEQFPDDENGRATGCRYESVSSQFYPRAESRPILVRTGSSRGRVLHLSR